MNKFFWKSSFFILLFVLFLGAFGFFSKNQVLAESPESKIILYFFYSRTCPHCIQEKAFLEKLEGKYDWLEIKKSIFSQENIPLIEDFYKQYNVPQDVYGYVPISFVGEKFFLGYDGDESTGKEIESYIVELSNNANFSSSTDASTTTLNSFLGSNRKVSFLGREVSLSALSPLSLTAVLGLLDGFNACAMVSLIFLLTALVATGLRRRVVLVGGTFIFVSGAVYFLFISAWLNLFLISKHLQLITSAVGVIIIVFSLFLLKDYYYGVVCRLCQIEQKKEGLFAKSERRLLEKMKKIMEKEGSLIIVLLGVSAVAAGINSVELVCSFGFPLAFTKILSDLHLSSFSYYGYLLIYIFFYMLDDFLVFLLAVFTLRITAVSEKYLKVIKLISGIVLFLLGLIFLIKPELLSLS